MDKKKKEDEEDEEEGGGKAKQHRNNNNNSKDFDVANGSNGVHVHRVPQIPSESPRRSCSLEDQQQDQQKVLHPPRRKRSNEPTTSHKRENNKEKHRKAATTQEVQEEDQQQIMEKSLEQLRRENNELKSKLEEQIRLNSVIVVNPSLKSVAAAEANAETSTASIKNAFHHHQQNARDIPLESSGTSLAIEETMGTASFANNQEEEETFQPSKLSAFSSVINGTIAATAADEEDSRRRQSTNSFMGITATRAPNELMLQPPHFAIPPNLFCPQSSFPFDGPFSSPNNTQMEFIRLAAQLAPFSMFSQTNLMAAAASSAIPSNPTQQSQRQQFLLNQSYGLPSSLAMPSGGTQGWHFPQQMASHQVAPDQPKLLSDYQPLTLDTSEHLQAYSKGRSHIADCHEGNLLMAEEKEDIPLDFSKKNANSDKHHFPQMTSNKNEKDKRKATTKSVITVTASTKATISRRDELPQIQLTKMVKKREEHAEMALIDSTTPTEKTTDEDEIGKKKTTAFGGISNPPHPPSPPPPSSSCASSRKKNMQEMAVSTTSHSPSSGNALILAQTSDTASDLDYKSLLDLPSSSSASLNNPPNAAHFLFRQQNRIENDFEASTIQNDENHQCPLINNQQQQHRDVRHREESTNKQQEENRPNAIVQNRKAPTNSKTTGVLHSSSLFFSSSSSASSSSSSSAAAGTSMLGILLATPSKRHTSPTVPASRTELYSGLAATAVSNNDENRHEPLTEQPADSKKQDTASDSEHSAIGHHHHHSPNSMDESLHSRNFGSGCSPSSILPDGAGSTATTICGSDRTHRSSLSPSGNSGCSGDDSSPLVRADPFHLYAKGMPEGNSNSNGANNLANHEEDCIIEDNQSATANEEDAVPNLRPKLKTSEDLERYMDRRRRNNEAAKRCRANRRAVFEFRSRRAQMLEAENGELRQEMIKLNNELEQLKAIIAANASAQQQNNHRLISS